MSQEQNKLSTTTRKGWNTRKSASHMFKAAQIKKSDCWLSHPFTPDALIRQQQRILVARSREQWANNDIDTSN